MKFFRVVFRKSLLLLVIALGLSSITKASDIIDSLLLRYSTQKKDTNKILTGFKIADYYQSERSFDKSFVILSEVNEMASEMPYGSFKFRTNKALAYNEYNRHLYEDAIFYCEEAVQVGRELKNDWYVAEVTNLMAGCYVNLGDYQRALVILDDLVEFARDKELPNNLALALTATAGVYYNQGEFEKSAHYLFETSEVYKELKDTARMAQTYRNLSLIYGQIKNYKLAKKYVNKSLEIGIFQSDDRRIVDAYSRYGVIYENEKKIDSALHYLHLALSFKDKVIEEDFIEVYGTLGNIYRDLEDFDSAMDYFEKAKNLLIKTRDMRMLSILYYNIGELQIMQKEFDKALINFNKLMEYANESGEKELLEKVNYGLYQVYSALGNYKSALDAYKSYREYGDSLREFNMANRLNEFEAEKQREIDKRVHELEIEQADELLKTERSYRRIITIIGVFGGLILISFLLYVYNRYRLTRYQNRIISDQEKLLRLKNEEMLDSISYAKRIQDAYLPEKDLFKSLFSDAFLLYLPKEIVSGDFYWYYQILDSPHPGHRVLYLAAADCTGHGVPGALMSMICINALQEVVINKGVRATGEILNEVREIVKSGLKSGNTSSQKDGMDISIIALHFVDSSECAERELLVKIEWSGANNPLWIVRKNSVDGFDLIEIKPDKQPIGFYSNESAFKTHAIDFQQDDVLYLFSDGFQDQFGGEKGKKFKSGKFKELLIELQGLPLPDQKERLHQIFKDWKGCNEQTDDVCVIGLRI